jgi:hypothetical protein
VRDLAKRVSLKRLFRGTLHQLEYRCGFSVCMVIECCTMFVVRRMASGHIGLRVYLFILSSRIQLVRFVSRVGFNCVTKQSLDLVLVR